MGGTRDGEMHIVHVSTQGWDVERCPRLLSRLDTCPSAPFGHRAVHA